MVLNIGFLKNKKPLKHKEKQAQKFNTLNALMV